MKRFVIAGLTVLVVAGAVGGYVVKHNADVKQRQRQERVKRADRAYRARVASWRRALQQWNTRQASYQWCKDVTSDTFSAMDEIQGKVTGGLNYNEYSDAVADVSSAVSRAIRESGRSDQGLGLRCLTEVTHHWRRRLTNTRRRLRSGESGTTA
jgi:hypothetical protein